MFSFFISFVVELNDCYINKTRTLIQQRHTVLLRCWRWSSSNMMMSLRVSRKTLPIMNQIREIIWCMCIACHALPIVWIVVNARWWAGWQVLYHLQIYSCTCICNCPYKTIRKCNRPRPRLRFSRSNYSMFCIYRCSCRPCRNTFTSGIVLHMLCCVSRVVLQWLWATLCSYMASIWIEKYAMMLYQCIINNKYTTTN